MRGMLSYVHFGSSLGIFTYSWRTMGLLKTNIVQTSLLYIPSIHIRLSKGISSIYKGCSETEGENLTFISPPGSYPLSGFTPFFGTVL